MTNILLIDDEIKICEFVKAYLDKEGFNTDVAYDGLTALSLFKKNDYSLIILDRMLPDVKGEDICKDIRRKSDIPIIMLTAKIEDEDKLQGFELGCDDYISKPFNVKELVFRVKAILKRVNSIDDKKIIKFKNGIEINTESHEVIVNGKKVALTNTEYKILLLMASNPQKIYSREEILESVVDEYYEKVDRVIDSHIKNLRQKIELDLKEGVIKTVYGVGYRFGLKN